jgi:hypothetical protein
MEHANTQAAFTAFIQACRTIQPEGSAEIRRFFEGVACFPYDKELLLQAFVYLNLERYLPHCECLLLFEKSPDLAHRTDLGKCDFVYLTAHQTLCLIETKYIDLDAHGTTAQRRRTKKRKEVLEQVDHLKLSLSQHWHIPVEQFEGAVFTTDPSLTTRGNEQGIKTEFVSIDALFTWQLEIRNTLIESTR